MLVLFYIHKVLYEWINERVFEWIEFSIALSYLIKVSWFLQEESEEKKQKRIEKEVRNMRNKIRHLKEKQDNMKRERMGYKMSLKNQQAALK